MHQSKSRAARWSLTAVVAAVGLGSVGTLVAQSFNEIPINGGNSFNTTWESFETSTTIADTPYTSYVSWDDSWLYLGLGGSDVGDGDCADPTTETCFVFETGEDQNKYIVYYLDVDPSKDAGATSARSLPSTNQSWELPEGMKADYMVQIRTDGVTSQTGQYTGEAFLYAYNGGGWEKVTDGSGPDGTSDLQIWDNNGSNFIEIGIKREALEPTTKVETRRSPSQVSVVGWLAHTDNIGTTMEDDRVSYAFFPSNAVAEDSLEEGGVARGMVELQSAYGFYLDDAQLPNASNGQANLNRPFLGSYDCPTSFPGDVGQATGQGNPFHTIPINGSNGFNSAKESFSTSTTASTGYTAYATWDRSKMYLGYTGSDIGGGDCADPSGNTCETFELGQSPQKWLVYYFDTDPKGSEGSSTASLPDGLGDTSIEPTLPFSADYAAFIRLDGESADASPYTGVRYLFKYEGGSWESQGPCALQVYDNNGSGFLEFSVDLTDLGSPIAVRTVSWILDAERDEAYAFWPEDASPNLDDKGVMTSSSSLSSSWSFELRDGVTPNVSGNKNASFGDLAEDQLTPQTYTVDGEVGDKERLPMHVLGRESESSPELAMTWDSSAIYLSLSGGTLNESGESLFIAFDEDPTLGKDPREGNGSSSEPSVGNASSDSNAPTYPFAADRVIRISGKSGGDGGSDADNAQSGNVYTVGGSGDWTEGALPSATKIRRAAEQGRTEISIPWSALNVADGEKFHMVVYLSEQGNGIPAQWPPENPQGQNPTLDYFYTFHRMEDVEVFSRAYLSTLQSSGSTLSEGLFNSVYFIIDSPGQNSATFSLGANTTVVGELLVGESVTLNFGANQDNPTGRNALRVGEQLTSLGTLQTDGAVLYTFDPSEGFPDDIEPGGGFAVKSVDTKLECISSLDGLVLYNSNTSVGCMMNP